MWSDAGETFETANDVIRAEMSLSSQINEREPQRGITLNSPHGACDSLAASYE
jgi:hypothetical protein